MSEQLFKVVFSGELTGEYNEATTRKRFSTLFNIDDERTNTLFSGKETVMRSKISKEDALKLMYKLAEAGCDSYLEEIQTEAAEEETRTAGEAGPPAA